MSKCNKVGRRMIVPQDVSAQDVRHKVYDGRM
jgi:hypothetical protein